jgi:hypothetical protein
MSHDFVNDDTVELLISNLNSVEAEIIGSILDSYSIPHFKKTRGSGSIMEIYTGVVYHGIDIYIPSNLHQIAKELINKQNIKEENMDGID